MVIRQEKAEDYEAVYHVVQEAFQNAEHTDGNEQNLVVALRKSKAFIPQLSLVAVEDQRVVGYILFTKAVVNGVQVLALAPLAVLPEYQNRGIGLDLIAEGHRAARSLGYGYSVVLGHPQYYPKAGYLPAQTVEMKAAVAGLVPATADLCNELNFYFSISIWIHHFTIVFLHLKNIKSGR